MFHDKLKKMNFNVSSIAFAIIKNTYTSNLYYIEWILKHRQNKTY